MRSPPASHYQKRNFPVNEARTVHIPRTAQLLIKQLGYRRAHSATRPPTPCHAQAQPTPTEKRAPRRIRGDGVHVEILPGIRLQKTKLRQHNRNKDEQSASDVHERAYGFKSIAIRAIIWSRHGCAGEWYAPSSPAPRRRGVAAGG